MPGPHSCRIVQHPAKPEAWSAGGVCFPVLSAGRNQAAWVTVGAASSDWGLGCTEAGALGACLPCSEEALCSLTSCVLGGLGPCHLRWRPCGHDAVKHCGLGTRPGRCGWGPGSLRRDEDEAQPGAAACGSRAWMDVTRTMELQGTVVSWRWGASASCWDRDASSLERVLEDVLRRWAGTGAGQGSCGNTMEALPTPTALRVWALTKSEELEGMPRS